MYKYIHYSAHLVIIYCNLTAGAQEMAEFRPSVGTIERGLKRILACLEYFDASHAFIRTVTNCYHSLSNSPKQIFSGENFRHQLEISAGFSAEKFCHPRFCQSLFSM